MSVDSIKGDAFSIEFHGDTSELLFKGTLRFQNHEDYAPMSGLMQAALEAAIDRGLPLVLDFRQLEFLNSSGINAISKFVIVARKADQSELKVRGSKAIYWQQKSLSNLKKLWPKVIIDIF
jgi:hypothetical protein